MQNVHTLADTQLQPECMIKHPNIQLLNLNDITSWRQKTTFTTRPQPGYTMPLDRWFVESLTHAPQLHCINLDCGTTRDGQSMTAMAYAVQTGLRIVTFTNAEATQTLVHVRQDSKFLHPGHVWNWWQWDQWSSLMAHTASHVNESASPFRCTVLLRY